MTPAGQTPRGEDDEDDDDGDAAAHPFLTLRDRFANPLLDLFDFNTSPSLNTTFGQAGPPAQDCTPR